MKITIQEIDYDIKTNKDFENLLYVFSVHSQENTSTVQTEILTALWGNIVDFIQTYDDFLTCLKLLDQKNMYLFISLVWLNISKYVLNINDLSRLLSYIADENNKIKLLLFYWEENLKKIIITAHDLWKILEWLHWYSEHIFFQYLWNDYIKKIFSEHKEIYLILNYLSPVWRDYLLNLITLELIVCKIRNHIDLWIILRRLSEPQFLEFLELLTKERLHVIFEEKSNLDHFLLRLSKKKEQLFLNFFNSF